MRLVTWNVTQGGGKAVADQVEALARSCPDVVALQEVRISTVEVYKRGLFDRGFNWMVSTFDLDEHREIRGDRRRDGLLIVSRWPLCVLPANDLLVPRPDDILSTIVRAEWGLFELHNAHVYHGTKGGMEGARLKGLTFEGIYRRLTSPSAIPQILCGDLNAPMEEHPDGRVLVWNERLTPGGPRAISGYERWVSAERSVIQGLVSHGFLDAYRHLHGYEKTPASWKSGRPPLRGRLDHVFASSRLNPIECCYRDDIRDTWSSLGKRPLSNHSPLEVLFQPRSAE